MFKKLAIFLVTPFVLLALDNSIIPTVEKFEQVESLNKEKFSSAQFDELSAAIAQKENKVRLVSYNVLFHLYDHNLDEINRWPARLPRLVEMINDLDADLIGVQELYPNQLADLMPFIEDTYAFYSKPEEDGELNGIFYRKDRFEVLESQIIFMSEDQDPTSATLTVLRLRDLKTDKEFVVSNTHLAFSKIEKRAFQARFIAEHMEAFANNYPTVLTGDLNAFPLRLDLGKLPFYDGDYVLRQMTKGSLRQAKEVSLLGHLGPLSTFSNEGQDPNPFKGEGTPGVFLDHILANDGVEVLIHAVNPGTVNGNFPSDHFPIMIDFLVK